MGSARSVKFLTRANRTLLAAVSHKRGVWRKFCEPGPRQPEESSGDRGGRVSLRELAAHVPLPQLDQAPFVGSEGMVHSNTSFERSLASLTPPFTCAGPSDRKERGRRQVKRLVRRPLAERKAHRYVSSVCWSMSGVFLRYSSSSCKTRLPTRTAALTK